MGRDAFDADVQRHGVRSGQRGAPWRRLRPAGWRGRICATAGLALARAHALRPGAVAAGGLVVLSRHDAGFGGAVSFNRRKGDDMIKFQDVVKRYKTQGISKWVLRGLNLEFERGRSVGILGRNGAGKSTIVRMIAGAEDPDFGTITRDGLISWPLGFGGALSGTMTGYDACMFVSRLYAVDARHVISFVQDFSELGHYFYEPVNSYSSGMRAKLNFGLSMSIDFDCYLIDEITAVGDSRFKAKCLEVFAERRKRSDIIMVSHSENTIRQYCDMGAILEDGLVRLYSDLDEAIFDYKKLMGA